MRQNWGAEDRAGTDGDVLPVDILDALQCHISEPVTLLRDGKCLGISARVVESPEDAVSAPAVCQPAGL